VHSQQLYKPWGEGRYASGTLPTTYKFTGQREEQSLGLYFYNARYYDPALGRFAQADTVVPNPGDPVAFDRFAYARNNPVNMVDPSGHGYCESEYAIAEDCAGWNSRIEIENAVIEQYRDPLHGDEDYNYRNFGEYRFEDTISGRKKWHTSIDAAGSSNLGEAVYPVLQGTVVDVGWEDSLGNFIVVEHDVLGEKLYSVYGHLGIEEGDGVNVSTGSPVTQDTVIGSVGNTNNSETHLHFEIRYASNVNLSDGKVTLRGKDYWAFDSTWHRKYFDLGIIYGYFDNRNAGNLSLP
jgi:RHS repeat-associated protein